ncbi:MAG: S8 family serine peptidase, partial [Myxococcota bacterium]|nr:S8 family serine peptidase [Myxococcota bacterium]
ADRPVFLRVHHAGGSPNATFDVMARGGDLVQPHPWGSVTDPGTHPEAFTVGAVRATAEYARLGPESFSSWGPTGEGLPKPDIAGPDGLSSSVYGVTGFYGTSAATPAVAASIALVMSRYPDMTPREAASWLTDSAMTERAVGDPPDPALGAGRARLPPPGAGSAGCGHGFAAVPLGCLLPLAVRRRRHRVRPSDDRVGYTAGLAGVHANAQAPQVHPRPRRPRRCMRSRRPPHE